MPRPEAEREASRNLRPVAYARGRALRPVSPCLRLRVDIELTPFQQGCSKGFAPGIEDVSRRKVRRRQRKGYHVALRAYLHVAPRRDLAAGRGPDRAVQRRYRGRWR